MAQDQSATRAESVRSQSAAAHKSETRLQEVIVTAQKYRQPLQQTPVPVTVVNTQALTANNQPRFQDYYASVPGLNLFPGTNTSVQQISIRGINSGYANNPTVAIAIDGVPFGSSTSFGAGETIPDIDPGDLDRVEVLRGPQGTLYGASSMGGLINFVTTDPSTSGFFGHAQVGGSAVENGAEMGYTVRGSANLPLGHQWAVLASGFTRVDPGYIDNPILHIRGTNRSRVSGGRLCALWTPSDAVYLKLNALYQYTKADGSPEVDAAPGLSGLQQNVLRGAGWSKTRIEDYSGTLRVTLDRIQITAISSYNITDLNPSFDYSSAFGGLTDAFYGVSGAPDVLDGRTNKFSQELRASIPFGTRIEWLLGGFYTHERSPYEQSILAVDPSTGLEVADALNIIEPTTLTEYAGFTDVTYHFTKRFDIQVGGRESEIKQTMEEIETGPWVPIFFGSPAPLLTPEQEAKENAFTYLVTPRYNVSRHVMAYLRFASGFRAGGINLNVVGVPPKYGSDTTRNYELGVKGYAFDHAFYYDASLYYIDWRNLQVLLATPLANYTGNAGRAKSQGAEISVKAVPVMGLTLGAWIAWDDAELTQAMPPTSTAYGVVGDKLPFSSRFSENLSLDELWMITDNMSGFIGGTVGYVGSRLGDFGTSPVSGRQYYPSYTKIDLHGGINFDSWTVNIYANNLADKRAIIAGGQGAFPPDAFYYIQPRTVGVTLTAKF